MTLTISRRPARAGAWGNAGACDRTGHAKPPEQHLSILAVATCMAMIFEKPISGGGQSGEHLMTPAEGQPSAAD